MHKNNKKIIKDDINFLEYPNWIINKKKKITSWVVEKENGKYELICPLGIPKHFDKIVIYSLLYKLYQLTGFNSYILNTNRYEIAKNVFSMNKDFGKNRYARIMHSLKKWQSISINFEGVFYANEEYAVRYFSVIDEVVLKKNSGELYIRFNESYINQLKDTTFYKLIDFEQYKKLSKDSSARLYEVLIKTFGNRQEWAINIQSLAEKLTFEKRENAKNYYPYDVLRYLKPAIIEINKKTDLNIDFKYNKETNVCVFKKLKQQLNFTPAKLLNENNKNKKVTTKLKTEYLKKFELLNEKEQKNILEAIERDQFLKFLPDLNSKICAYLLKNEKNLY